MKKNHDEEIPQRDKYIVNSDNTDVIDINAYNQVRYVVKCPGDIGDSLRVRLNVKDAYERKVRSRDLSATPTSVNQGVARFDMNDLKQDNVCLGMLDVDIILNEQKMISIPNRLRIADPTRDPWKTMLVIISFSEWGDLYDLFITTMEDGPLPPPPPPAAKVVYYGWNVTENQLLQGLEEEGVAFAEGGVSKTTNVNINFTCGLRTVLWTLTREEKESDIKVTQNGYEVTFDPNQWRLKTIIINDITYILKYIYFLGDATLATVIVK